MDDRPEKIPKGGMTTEELVRKAKALNEEVRAMSERNAMRLRKVDYHLARLRAIANGE